jgi:hypothetical protein
MGVFDHFPYTNFHELNLEWILLALKEIQQTMEDFVSLNAIKYADPIQWNITKQYEKNTIVIDPLTGTAYISVRPVPAGAAITDTDYWTVVFDLGQFVVKMAHNLANVVEPETTLTATVSSSYNDWIIWGDILYRNINPSGIIAGDAYVIGSNIESFTVEDVIGHIQDLTTTDKSNLVAAINEVLQTLIDTTGDLNDLTTTDKSNLVAAINEVADEVLGKIGDLNDLTTTDKSNLVAAINEVDSHLPDFKKVTERVFNVKENGGDATGTTSCTSLITTAISDGYNVIYFESGRYLVDGAAIDAVNGITFRGCNQYKSTLIIAGAGFIIDTGAFCVFEDLQFVTNQNSSTAIVLNTSYNTIRNVLFNDTSDGFFQHCIILGDTNSAWFTLIENVKINDVNSPNADNGIGILLKQAFNTLIDNLFCDRKYMAIQSVTPAGYSRCEGLQITAANIVHCHYGCNFDGGNMFTLTNVIIDQMIYKGIEATDVINLWIDSAYIAPELTADQYYTGINLTRCKNTKIDGLLASNLNRNSLISLLSCEGLTISASRFESCPLGIGFSDALSKNCTIHDIYCDGVTTALYLQGTNITYYNIYDGAVSLVNVNEQRGMGYVAEADVLDDVATTWYDFTVPISSIGSVPQFAFAMIANAEADYSIVYSRSSSTNTALQFRLKRNDGNVIGNIAFQVIVHFYK